MIYRVLVKHLICSGSPFAVVGGKNNNVSREKQIFFVFFVIFFHVKQQNKSPPLGKAETMKRVLHQKTKMLKVYGKDSAKFLHLQIFVQ